MKTGERKEVNQYEKVLISDRNMIKNNSQMEQWSILSDNFVYVRLEGNDVINGIIKCRCLILLN